MLEWRADVKLKLRRSVFTHGCRWLVPKSLNLGHLNDYDDDYQCTNLTFYVHKLTITAVLLTFFNPAKVG